MPRLRSLILDHNLLIEIPEKIFIDQFNLKKLSAIDNRLTKIPSTICTS